jgi:aminoethylphosphonate catabolism LysR family transcriptional regulator
MNPTWLRAFDAVARERSFTRAAAAAAVSQPTLSSQVRALERAYAVRLFERRGRGIALTELGERLFAVSSRLEAVEAEAAAVLAGSKALASGLLRVAADNAFHAMPILAELRRRHAGLTFRLAIGNSADVLQRVLDDAVDVAVTAKVAPDRRLDAVRLRGDRLVLFAPAAHAWASRRRVRLADLAGQAVVLRERGSYTREVFERAVGEAGVALGPVMEVETREGVREAVAAGFGIGAVFESELGADRRFRAVEVADAAFGVGEYAVCLGARRALALVDAFMSIAAETAAPGAAPRPASAGAAKP